MVDPKYGINVQLDENNLLYVSAAKGDRVGGVNPPFYNTPACNAALARAWLPKRRAQHLLRRFAVELRDRLQESALQRPRRQDASAPSTSSWSDIQQIVQVPACTEGFTSNLGKATSKGFDLQIDALIAQGLKVGLSVGYTDARNATTITSGGNNVVADGQQINNFASPWIVVPTLEYTFPIATGHERLRAAR